MANLTSNYRRPYNRGMANLAIFQGLVAANIELFQGAVVGKNQAGYYVNAVSTLGSLRELAIVRDYVDNRGGLDGAKEVALERGCHAFDTWTGTISKLHVGDDAVIDTDNNLIKRWDPTTLPTAVNLGDGNSMSLQALVPGVTFKAVAEGNSKPLTFRSDKPGEIIISLKTDGGGAVHTDNTGTAVTAALNAHPVAGALAKAAVLGTGATVLAAIAATTLSASRLGEIVDVTADTVYVDTTK